MREARNSRLFTRIKLNTPGPWQYRSLQTQPKSRSLLPTARTNVLHSRANSPGDQREVEQEHAKDMALVDIEDFDVRSKVGPLMAVAPALPIRDLYHLVIDTKGHMTKAIKRAIRMSEAPDQLRTATLRSSQQEKSTNPDTEEIKVKIDLSDSTFKWDDHAPAAEPITTSNARSSNTNPRPRSTHRFRSLYSTESRKRIKPPTLTYPRTGIKRTKAILSKRANAGETSSDRDFVIADNAIQYSLNYDKSHKYEGLCGKATPRRRRNYTS